MKNQSIIERMMTWIRKPIEKKVFGLGGRIAALSYKNWIRTRDYQFEGVLHPVELLDEPSESLAHSTHYQVSNDYSLKLLLDEIFFEGEDFPLFVDIGCGKGMPPLFASRFYPFKRCVGIDFSEKLIREAQQNLEKSGQTSVEFFQADATSFKIPDQRAVVFLANPFGPEIMRRFLENNREHFRSQGSLLAYSFDIHRHILPELGFEVIYRSPMFAHSIWRLREPSTVSS